MLKRTHVARDLEVAPGLIIVPEFRREQALHVCRLVDCAFINA